MRHVLSVRERSAYMPAGTWELHRGIFKSEFRHRRARCSAGMPRRDWIIFGVGVAALVALIALS
jgi:hypothetical protein